MSDLTPADVAKRITGAEADQSDRVESEFQCASPHCGEDDVKRLNSEYGLLLLGSRAVIVQERADAPVEDRVRFLSLDAFSAFYANQTVRLEETILSPGGAIEIRARHVRASSFWLQSPLRRTLEGIEFFPDPFLGPLAPVSDRLFYSGDKERPTPGYLNLWRGFDVRPALSLSKEKRRAKYAIFYDHLLTNICNGDQALCDWLWAWFAHMIQRPRERAGTAVVLRGGEGVGKTKIGEVIGSLFRSHYFLVDDARYLTGNFNAHMASCILLQVDEGFWAGDKSAEGRLKGLITSGFQMVEHKGVDPIRLRNFVRVLFSSNEDWVVPVGLDGRRFAVLDVASHALRNFEYFGEMERELADGGREALLADLLEYDLEAPGAPNVREVPRTAALLEQKFRSLSPVASWWVQRLFDGTPTHRFSTWHNRVPIQTLYSDYCRSADRLGIRRKATEIEFGLQLRKLVGRQLPRRRVTEDVEVVGADGRTETVIKRVWAYELPPLADCRNAFCVAAGQAVNWHEDDDPPEIKEWPND
jgi:hypothetical protein